MPTVIILDKSYLDGASATSIAALCKEYSVIVTETLFFELMTTKPESQVRCFSKLPNQAGAFSLLPTLGVLLRAEIETGSPCGPFDKHVKEGLARFHPNLRTGSYVMDDETQTALDSWMREVSRNTLAFLERCKCVHQFFPELNGIEYRKFPAAVTAARSRVALDPYLVREVYESFSREDLPHNAPLANEISGEWAWFRRIQCHLLAALRVFERYQGKVPDNPSCDVFTRIEHSMHDLDYLVLGSIAGAIASNDKEVIDDFRLVVPTGTYVTTLPR
jgi:hypothetical protein